MAGPAPVELTRDCEECGLEGGVVEVYDVLVAACRFGLPARASCKLCEATHEGMFDRSPAKELREIAANRCPACLGELTPAAIDDRACASCGARADLRVAGAPLVFATRAEFDAALDRWAVREKFASRGALADATFVDSDLGRLFARYSAGERLEIVADPFANMGVRTTGSPSPRDESGRRSAPRLSSTSTRVAEGAREPATEPLARPIPVVAPQPTPKSERPSVVPPPSAPPRAIVYPLVSVIAADGEIHPLERQLIDRFLQSEGLALLAEEECRVHHPSTVAHFIRPDRREEVVKLMCESAAIDGLPDESERRVIRAYATAWNIDDEKVDFWIWGYEAMNTSLSRQLFLKIRRFVLSARWSETEVDP